MSTRARRMRADAEPAEPLSLSDCDGLSWMANKEAAIGAAAAAECAVAACAGLPSQCAAESPQQLVHAFEWVTEGGLSSRSLRRSFRDALAEGIAEGIALTHKSLCDNDDRIPLSLPALRRDASTSSTPRAASDCSDADDDEAEYSRCSFSSSSDCSGDEDSFDADSQAEDEIAPLSAPLDLSSHCGEVDWDAWAAEEQAAEAAESWLFAADPAAKHLHLGDLVHNSAAGIVASVCPETGARLGAFRTRHRNALHLFPGPTYRHRGWDWRCSQRHTNDKDLHYWRPSTKDGLNITRLQQGSRSGFNKRRNVTDSSAHAPSSTRPPVPNPYDHCPKKRTEAMKTRKQSKAEGRRDNGKSDGAHKAARNATHTQRHSLAAPTRPVMQTASPAHQLVLQQRAARKVQLAQAAAHPTRVAKHMRPCSASRLVRSSKPSGKVIMHPSQLVRGDVKTRHCSSFETFRERFYLKHRAALENALAGSGRRVVDVRFAPIASHARSRFMTKLHTLRPASEAEVPMVFHGTRIDNMDSICRRGLLVPNPSVNGVRVVNGSAYGVGIYTSKAASYSAGYASNSTSTLFVCAALTTGAKPYSYGAADVAVQSSPEVVVSGQVVVLMEEARVCPLFLLDFQDETHNRFSYGATLATRDQAPWAPAYLLRVMLARMHTRFRKFGAINAYTLLHAATQQD